MYQQKLNSGKKLNSGIIDGYFNANDFGNKNSINGGASNSGENQSHDYQLMVIDNNMKATKSCSHNEEMVLLWKLRSLLTNQIESTGGGVR